MQLQCPDLCADKQGVSSSRTVAPPVRILPRTILDSSCSPLIGLKNSFQHNIVAWPSIICFGHVDIVVILFKSTLLDIINIGSNSSSSIVIITFR